MKTMCVPIQNALSDFRATNASMGYDEEATVAASNGTLASIEYYKEKGPGERTKCAHRGLLADARYAGVVYRACAAVSWSKRIRSVATSARVAVPKGFSSPAPLPVITP